MGRYERSLLDPDLKGERLRYVFRDHIDTHLAYALAMTEKNGEPSRVSALTETISHRTGNGEK